MRKDGRQLPASLTTSYHPCQSSNKERYAYYTATSCLSPPQLVPGLPANCPLLASWSGVQRLAVFPRPTEGVEQWAGLAEASWDAAQWNSITRRLANQSHGNSCIPPLAPHLLPLPGYFMSLREAAREGGVLQGSDILLYSRYYRSALHECVLGLRAEERRCPSLDCGRQAQIFSTMALAWHLVEILFIEVC